MQVRAGCELSLEADAPSPVVAMLRPRSGQGRWRVNGAEGFQPGHGFGEFEDSFGNRCQRFLVPRGSTCIRIDASVETDPRLPGDPAACRVPPEALPPETLQFLLPSRYCPSDRPEMFRRALEIVDEAPAGYQQVEAIRRWIREKISYRYGVSNAHTDAQETLDQGAGVCRDFAHIGATLCRTLDIPARVVAGWLHELKPMDMHAWFEAYVGDRWYAFDATQAEQRGGRVVIAHGRDAADVAFLTSYKPLQAVSIRVWTELDEAA